MSVQVCISSFLGNSPQLSTQELFSGFLTETYQNIPKTFPERFHSILTKHESDYQTILQKEIDEGCGGCTSNYTNYTVLHGHIRYVLLPLFAFSAH